MHNPSSQADGLVIHPVITPRQHAAGERADVGEHFCQMFDLISARKGRARPALQAHAEERSAELELRATQGALARAHESIVKIGLELEAERRARQYAEVKSRVEQHACEEAMEVLDETVQPLRDLKVAAAEQREQIEQQARTYAALEARTQAVQAQLKGTEAALARAVELAAQIRLQVVTEQLAREDAETGARTEQVAREEALQALLDVRNAAAEQQVQAEEQARTYAELEAKHEAVEAQLKETRAALAQSKSDAEHNAQQHAQMTSDLQRERRAREYAEAKAQTERHARENAVHAPSKKEAPAGFWKKLLG